MIIQKLFMPSDWYFSMIGFTPHYYNFCFQGLLRSLRLRVLQLVWIPLILDLIELSGLQGQAFPMLVLGAEVNVGLGFSVLDKALWFIRPRVLRGPGSFALLFRVPSLPLCRLNAALRDLLENSVRSGLGVFPYSIKGGRAFHFQLLL